MTTPYTMQTWADGSSGGTPISAARLNHIEAGIAAAGTSFNVKASTYGAVGDVKNMDVSCTSGSNVCTLLGSWPADLGGGTYPAQFNSISAFTAADVGKKFLIAGAGVAGAALIGTFTAFVDATHMTMSLNAGTTITDSHSQPIYGSNWPTANFGTDDSVAIQAAIDAAYALSAIAKVGGAEVTLPPGAYYAAGVIKRSGVRLVGSGYNTIVMTAPDSGTTPTISLGDPQQSLNQSYFFGSIENMIIMGQRLGQVNARPVDLTVNTNVAQTFLGAGHNDPRFVMRDVIVMESFSDYAIYVSRGMRGSHFENVSVLAVSQHGWNISCTDSNFEHCEVGGFAQTTIGFGFSVLLPENHFTDCKAWYPNIAASSGWYVTDDNQYLSNCQSQDNTGYGLILDGNTNAVQSCVIQGFHSGGDGLGAAYLKGTVESCTIDIVVGEADRNPQNASGLTIDNTGVKNNDISIMADNSHMSATYVALVLANGAVAGQNRVKSQVCQGQQRGTFSPAAAGTVTPNISDGTLLNIQMPAGNITVANLTATPTTALQIPVGAELTFVFKQDATGSRTVAWGGTFNSAPAIPALTAAANSFSVYKWVNNGTLGTPVWTLIAKA